MSLSVLLPLPSSIALNERVYEDYGNGAAVSGWVLLHGHRARSVACLCVCVLARLMGSKCVRSSHIKKYLITLLFHL